MEVANEDARGPSHPGGLPDRSRWSKGQRVATTGEVSRRPTHPGRGARAGRDSQRAVVRWNPAIYDAATDGNAVGGPLPSSATGVTNGLFAVALDFGAGVFDGSAR